MVRIYDQEGLNEPAKAVSVLQLVVTERPNSAALYAALASTPTAPTTPASATSPPPRRSRSRRATSACACATNSPKRRRTPPATDLHDHYNGTTSRKQAQRHVHGTVEDNQHEPAKIARQNPRVRSGASQAVSSIPDGPFPRATRSGVGPLGGATARVELLADRHRAGMAVAGPGSQQHQQPGLRGCPHLVTLARRELDEQPGATAPARRRTSKSRSRHRHEPRSLVNLVIRRPRRPRGPARLPSPHRSRRGSRQSGLRSSPFRSQLCTTTPSDRRARSATRPSRLVAIRAPAHDD